MPFAKGQSGNPGGRNVDRPWREALRSISREVVDPITKKNKLGVLAEKVFELALDGDIRAIAEIAQRIDGMPQQQLDVNPGDDLGLEERRVFAGLLAAFIASRRADLGEPGTQH
jgi:hypothetical protein